MVEGSAFLLLCHDDVLLEHNAVQMMVEAAFRTNAGIVTPKIVAYEDPLILLHVGQTCEASGSDDSDESSWWWTTVTQPDSTGNNTVSTSSSGGSETSSSGSYSGPAESPDFRYYPGPGASAPASPTAPGSPWNLSLPAVALLQPDTLRDASRSW